jgi:UDP-2,3-diacylglucosamine pyrophosphatase LpxH
LRKVFIISDLHLGGAYPIPPEAGKRGFRLCTHAEVIVRFVDQLAKEIAENGISELILNGDTVDFLAERDGDTEAWSAFTADPKLAVGKFNTIVARDPEVFASLGRFLDAGGRLTVLLGNHDVELSLPPVRKALRKALGVRPGHDFEFILDGEAYIVGDALIEHGNRYDAWNQIDYDGLRRVRSLMSRRQGIPDNYLFEPPAGSEMVVSVINEIKREYAFVDLLKPETSAAVPMLLALEPSYRERFGKIARLWYWTRSHGLEGPTLPKFGGNIRARVEAGDKPIGHNIRARATTSNAAQDVLGALDESAALKGVIADALGGNGADFLAELEDENTTDGVPGVAGTKISARDTFARVLGLFDLLKGSKSTTIERRVRALLKAMRGVQDVDTFDHGKESAQEYLEAARKLTKEGGFRYVVFGHTHQAKRIDLGNDCWYLNSGTWADVLRFPIEILTLPEADALAKLTTFVEEMQAGNFRRSALFRPTYVRLDVDDEQGKVVEAALYDALTESVL